MFNNIRNTQHALQNINQPQHHLGAPGTGGCFSLGALQPWLLHVSLFLCIPPHSTPTNIKKQHILFPTKTFF